MKRLIQVAEADDAKPWALLQRHSPGAALPNRMFVVSQEAVEALREAEIDFIVLPNDPYELTEQGVASGERI